MPGKISKKALATLRAKKKVVGKRKPAVIKKEKIKLNDKVMLTKAKKKAVRKKLAKT